MKILGGGVIATFLILIALIAIPKAYLLSLMGVEETHDYNRKVSQEDRHAELVGAAPLPVKPLNVIVKKSRNSCAVIDRAEIDGEAGWIYWHWACGGSNDAYVSLSYSLRSPDGTTISSDWNWAIASSPVESGQKFEFKINVKPDPRAVDWIVSSGQISTF